MQCAVIGIIYGPSLYYLSCPVKCLGVTILVSHTHCGMFGVASSSLRMLGTMTMGLTNDVHSSFSDTGDIAETPHTYKVVGNTNEFQLTIAETTFGGVSFGPQKEAVLDYGEIL